MAKKGRGGQRRSTSSRNAAQRIVFVLLSFPRWCLPRRWCCLSLPTRSPTPHHVAYDHQRPCCTTTRTASSEGGARRRSTRTFGGLRAAALPSFRSAPLVGSPRRLGRSHPTTRAVLQNKKSCCAWIERHTTNIMASAVESGWDNDNETGPSVAAAAAAESSRRRALVSPLTREEAEAEENESHDTSGSTSGQRRRKQRTALVILNAPIPATSTLFDALWESSTIRVCADGGANRLYTSRPSLLPHLVIGDLDSLSPAVSAHYQSMGVEVRRVHDQDRNDLDKALEALATSGIAGRAREEGEDGEEEEGATPGGDDEDDGARGHWYDHVVVYGAFGGRFDQEMASLQALFRWHDNPDHSSSWQTLWLYDDHSCACLIPAAATSSSCEDNDGSDDLPYTVRLAPQWEGPVCGLIPLGGKCNSVTTTGLQWNLLNQSLEFGGLVSTSNQVVDGVHASIRTSHPLIWTVQVHGSSNNAWDEEPSSFDVDGGVGTDAAVDFTPVP